MANRWDVPLLKIVLKKQAIQFEVMIADVQKVIDEQSLTSRKSPRFDFNSYHTFEEVTRNY